MMSKILKVLPKCNSHKPNNIYMKCTPMLMVKQQQSTVANAEQIKSFDEIPGPKSYPVVGNLFSIKGLGGDLNYKNFEELSHQLQKKYGDIAKLSILGETIVFIFHPDFVKKVFQSDGPMPLRRSLEGLRKYFEMKGYPQTLANSGMERWRTLRSASNPIVSRPQSVHYFLKEHDKIANDFVKYINKKFEKGSNSLMFNNFDLKLKLLTLELISVIAFDNRLYCVDDELENAKQFNELIKSVDTFFATLGTLTNGLPFWKWFPTSTWKQFVQASDVVFGIARKYVENAYEELKTISEEDRKNLNSKTILQQYLLAQDKYKLTINDIITLTTGLLFAGIDTTGTALQFALYEIAKNQQIQEELYQEIKKTIKDDETVTEDHLAQMQYLKAIVKETLRVHSVAPANNRVLTTDLVIDNYLIPKGTNIIMGVMYITQSDRFFKNPDVFEPKRWMKGLNEYESVHPYSNLPFGFGARQCVGRRIAEQEIYISLIRLIQNFKLEYNGEKIGHLMRLVTSPDKPLNLKITKRS